MLRLFFLSIVFFLTHSYAASLIAKVDVIVVNTWALPKATTKALEYLKNGETATTAIVEGCNVCEETYRVCGASIGFGGSPDENGETALDAMIMDGPTHDVGAVANLRRVKSAIKVAKAVMDYTKETLLVGDLATNFAKEMGFTTSNLSSNGSVNQWKAWKKKNCQPNFWQNVSPDPTSHCGPYKPDLQIQKMKQYAKNKWSNSRFNAYVDTKHHDTIGMVALDNFGNMAAGTTTNGATFKVPGRVGDSPIMGAGAYVDNDVGGAAATGDGDVMMRFLPTFEVVKLMEMGMSPKAATQQVIMKIAKFYPKYSGALLALNKNGSIGAACYGFWGFQYTVGSKLSGGVKTVAMNCTKHEG